MEEIYLGPTPCGESCAQVGEDNFRQKATKEMNAYINQLYREFPYAQDLGIVFKKKWSPHDFGEYGEVVMKWNENNQEADEYAYRIDANAPENWDEEALKELNNDND